MNKEKYINSEPNDNQISVINNFIINLNNKLDFLFELSDKMENRLDAFYGPQPDVDKDAAESKGYSQTVLPICDRLHNSLSRVEYLMEKSKINIERLSNII